jgi:uncharacterized protein (TIGR00369 family)
MEQGQRAKEVRFTDPILVSCTTERTRARLRVAENRLQTDSDRRSRTVTWQDPYTVPRAAAGRTGLEILTEVFDGRLPPPPITVTMGFRGAEVSAGRAVFVGDPGEFLYNPIGSVHGAFAMALLDSAMGCAVHSTLAAGEQYTTLEVKVNFIRPITTDTGRVRCEGVVVHRGGRIATAEGKVIAEGSGKLLAHGSTTCLVMRS